MAPPWYREEQTRVYFAFAASDLGLVTPVLDDLKSMRPGLVIDYALTGEPFASARSEYIRASLALRIKRTMTMICLFRTDVLLDDWVLWSLEVAHRLRIPLLGAALETAPAATVDLLSSAGVEIVACDAETLDSELSRTLVRSHAQSRVDDVVKPLSTFVPHQLR
jgi:hypothetical protein